MTRFAITDLMKNKDLLERNPELKVMATTACWPLTYRCPSDLTPSFTSEADFQQAIIDCARSHGWEAYHTQNSRFSEANFPDLFLVREQDRDLNSSVGEAVALECKMPRQKPRPGRYTKKGRYILGQQEWIDLLNRVPGIRAKVVWPSDWNAIKEMLK